MVFIAHVGHNKIPFLSISGYDYWSEYKLNGQSVIYGHSNGAAGR